MPNRILRAGILTSPRIAKLGWSEEVFYRRLHSVVDDFGRYYADEGMLRAACYPRQLNKVSDSDIGKWLRACVDAALVRVYPAEDGERYLEVLDFGQQVRAKKSSFPDERSTCAADATQTQANARLDVFVFVDESSVPYGTGGKPPAAGTEKPEDPAPDPRRELYLAGKSLLEEQGMPKAQTGSFITKLAKDYGQDCALEAVRSAVTNRPLEAAAYLKATCQRLKGERKDPVTTPGESTEEYTARMARAAEADKGRAVPPPKERMAMARSALKVVA
jgi:hypothetical protein